MLGPPLDEGPIDVCSTDVAQSVGEERRASSGDGDVGGEASGSAAAASGAESARANGACDPSRCLARIWDSGRLTQCRVLKRPFCGRHAKEQVHGRADEPIPETVAKKLKGPQRLQPEAPHSAQRAPAARVVPAKFPEIIGKYVSVTYMAGTRKGTERRVRIMKPILLKDGPGFQVEESDGSIRSYCQQHMQEVTIVDGFHQLPSGTRLPGGDVVGHAGLLGPGSARPAMPGQGGGPGLDAVPRGARLGGPRWSVAPQRVGQVVGQGSRELAKKPRATSGEMLRLLRQVLDEAAYATAVENSLKDSAHREAGIVLMGDRLRRLGLQRVETEALGNCQFIAVQQSGGLGMTPAELRETVCEYMNEFADEISNFMVGLAEDRGGLDSYMDYMRGPYGWGDDCTLSAMAHILCRPIHVVTTTRMASYVRQIEPPSTVASCEWGPPIVLALYGERHYEATAAL